MPLCRKIGHLAPVLTLTRSLSSSASNNLSSIHSIGLLSPQKVSRTVVHQDQRWYIYVDLAPLSNGLPNSYTPSLISCMQPYQSLGSITHFEKIQLHLSRKKVDVPRPKTRHDSNAIPTSAAHPIESRKPLGKMCSSITSLVLAQ